MKSRAFYRLSHLPPRIAYSLGLGPLVGRLVLLLTTTGCKSGLLRVTPLQYEAINGDIYVGSARGLKADWVRNIQANPTVEVHVKSERFQGTAQVVTDPAHITDYLEVRLQRHSRMIVAILRSDGVPIPPSRADLEQYASRLALIIIKRDTVRP